MDNTTPFGRDRTLQFLFKEQKLLGKSNEDRITHIVCLDSLSIAGSKVITACINDRGRIDYNQMNNRIKKLSTMNWSSDGPLKYVKGVSGSKSLAIDLIDMMGL